MKFETVGRGRSIRYVDPMPKDNGFGRVDYSFETPAGKMERSVRLSRSELPDGSYVLIGEGIFLPGFLGDRDLMGEYIRELSDLEIIDERR